MISEREAMAIIDDPKNDNYQDTYVVKNGDGGYTAIDNKSGADCLTEDFSTAAQARAWLRNEFDVEDYLVGRVSDSGQLIVKNNNFRSE